MVLEARKDAESIGYPDLGEPENLGDNFIDYNIREEQTKDSFNVINANNQTTTGLANIIPGVNEPKLIASTSIIGGAGGGGGGNTVINLSTATTVSPGSAGTFETSTIASGGEGWTLSGSYIYPTAGSYVITRMVYTHNANRLLDMVDLNVWRGGGYPTELWSDGNGKSRYRATTAYEFEDGDKLLIGYRFSGGTASNQTDGTLTFIKVS